eukprot:5153922-Amphidinium_carterae.1
MATAATQHCVVQACTMQKVQFAPRHPERTIYIRAHTGDSSLQILRRSNAPTGRVIQCAVEVAELRTITDENIFDNDEDNLMQEIHNSMNGLERRRLTSRSTMYTLRTTLKRLDDQFNIQTAYTADDVTRLQQ